MPRRTRRTPLADHPSLFQASLSFAKTSPRVARALSHANVIVRSFDDGAPIASVSPSGGEAGEAEYDVSAANPWFDAAAYQQSVFAEPAPIAPLEDANARPAQAGLRSNGAASHCAPENAATPARRASPSDHTPIPTFVSAPDAAPAAPDTAPGEIAAFSSDPKKRSKSFTARQMDKLIDDDDFKADLGAILGENLTRQTSPSKQPPSATTAPNNPPSAPVPTPQQAAALANEAPSEHEIFNKIRENMRFANAYELAPVSLSRRFDSFDKQGRRGAPPVRQSAAMQAQPAPEVIPAPAPVAPLVQTLRRYTEEERVAQYGDPRVSPDDWAAANLVPVTIRQMSDVQGAGAFTFHRLGARSIVDLFTTWETAGLIGDILSFDATYASAPPHGPSSDAHLWGIAFDINTKWNEPGDTPVPLHNKGAVGTFVEIANQHGFVCNVEDTRAPAGLHFELGHRI